MSADPCDVFPIMWRKSCVGNFLGILNPLNALDGFIV